MQYLNRMELRRLFQVAYQHNRLHHLALCVGFWHGLRVSELIQIRGWDIQDGQLSVRRCGKDSQFEGLFRLGMILTCEPSFNSRLRGRTPSGFLDFLSEPSPLPEAHCSR